MGYPIYKLLRSVNRQYPNNGFINYVDVKEDLYDSYKGQQIDEDLRDLINETIQEVYKDVALDEVYSFPTVAGQNQYQLPQDCDLRDIQEVTRTYAYRPLRPPHGGPMPPLPIVYTLFFDANGGTGEMEPMECNIGESITLPECEFEPPEGATFKCWEINGEEYNPGDTYEMQGDFIATAIWDNGGTGHRYIVRFRNAVNDDDYIVLKWLPVGGGELSTQLFFNDIQGFLTGEGGKLSGDYEYIRAYYNDELFYECDVDVVHTTFELVDLYHPGATRPTPSVETEVSFEVTDETKGNMGTLPGGNIITYISKTVNSGGLVGDDFVQNELAVSPNAGYVFDGWSLDGTNVIPITAILNTTVPDEGLHYIAVFSNE
jgi:hypothetical protein